MEGLQIDFGIIVKVLSLVNIYYKIILNNRSIKVFNNGEMGRDFTYVDDIVDGIIKVIGIPAKPNKEWDAKDPEISSSSVRLKPAYGKMFNIF